VARRWRIRHKLMLGLALAVFVLALVLGGAVRGLWAYWSANNNVRDLHKELKAAEEFNQAVARLVAPDTLTRLKQYPADAPEATREARDKLTAYEDALREDLPQRREPGNGEQALALVKILRDDLDLFEKEIVDFARQPTAKFAGQAESASSDALDKCTADLARSAKDLREYIYGDLDNLVGTRNRQNYQGALWVIVPAVVVALMLLLALLRSFYGWIFYPIRDLEAGVNRVARGDFAHRIEVNSGDEMEDLAAAFNDMTQRLHTLYTDLARQVNERSRQLVRSERLASVGFLAAGVAHEINNPLASILFCAEALEARLNELPHRLPPLSPRGRGAGGEGDALEVFARYLKMIQEESLRCKNITERLLAFSRSGERRREPTDLAQLVQSVLDVTQHLPSSKGKRLDFARPPGRLLAPVNVEEIKQVVLNLVVNALDSMDEGGRLTIRLGQGDGMAEVSFSDTGCGMSQEVLENIFEPFFTRSRTGKGTGLGLTISHRIVTQHGGDIEAASAGPGQGSTFTVRLPLRDDGTAAAPEPGRGRNGGAMAA